MNTSTDNTTSRGIHRGIWIGGGLMALTIIALATALVVKGNHGDAPATDALLTAPGAASTATTADGTQPTQVAQSTSGANAEHGGAHHGPNHHEHEHEHEGNGNGGAGADGASGGPNGNSSVANESTAAPTQVAAVCTTCGVIDSYSAVTLQGQNNGIGAVAGGIGGALIGSKIGGRGNHTVGGLIGAVGGGLIGNAVESHERKSTAYDVHVRMNDGSVRTIRQATIPQVGTHVHVDANNVMTIDPAQG